MNVSPRTRSRRLRMFAALIIGLLAQSCGGEEAPHWNVLLVTLDTTRADYLSCYGEDKATTPVLDALAAQGTRFDYACTTSAATPISHASILTGLWNHQHGVRVISADSGFRLDDTHPTLFTTLAEAGWNTAAIHSSFTVSSYFGLTRGCEHVDDITTEFSRDDETDSWDLNRFQRRSDDTTDLALEYLADQREESAPWAMWLHYWDPHDTGLVPPAELLKDVPLDRRGKPARSLQLYSAEVSYVDAQLGRLIEDLRKSGELERTMIVIVGDHGEGLGDHGWGGHRLLYREQMRVPMIICLPTGAHAETTELVAEVPGVVRTIDVYPTILDYLQLDEPQPVSGSSLRSMIEGRETGSRIAFADQLNGYDRNATLLARLPLDDFLYCVVKDGWKLIYRPSNPEESLLYDIAADPLEENSLFLERGDIATALKQELAKQSAWVTAPFPPDENGVGAEAMEALGSLGYVAGDASGGLAEDWEWACPTDDSKRFEDAESAECSGSRPVLVRRRQ